MRSCPAIAVPDSHGSTRSHAVVTADGSFLSEIHRPDVNLVVWTRRPATGLGPFLDRLSPSALPAFGYEGAMRPVCRSLRLHLTGGPSARFRGLSRLAEDIVGLTARYAALSGAWLVRVRLAPVADDSCRLFHTDRVGLRLLTTYRGPGTEWLPNDAVDRTALGRGSNDAICRDAGRVRCLPRFAVGLLKGEAWPGNAGNGIVHRSPPLAGSGQWRLLLCIDQGNDHD